MEKRNFFFKENDEKIFQKIDTHKKFQIDIFFKRIFKTSNVMESFRSQKISFW